jgi:pilus assembly protein Flp/PilA
MLFFPHDESGQGLIEYALILILVSLVVIVILTTFGQTIGNAYSNVVQRI